MAGLKLFQLKTIRIDFDEAIKMGALAFFEDKYEGDVRVLKKWQMILRLASMEFVVELMLLIF